MNNTAYLAFESDAPAPLAVSEQPAARFANFGPAALSDTELLALMIQAGAIGAARALDIARQLLAQAGTITALASWTPLDFERIKGIGRGKGQQLAALIEIARRMMRPADAAPMLDRADIVAEYMGPIARGLEVEKFWVLCLNRKNRLLKCVEVTSGTASSSLVHPREVFRQAIREGASAIICVHNHPSGDPAPSSADVRVTRQLREAARAVEIDLLDHVIVGQRATDPAGLGHFSFRCGGLL